MTAANPPDSLPRLSPRACWRAALARDFRHDADFVFAVRSTGVYCRPSCPARRPRRQQVLFFGEPAAAEREGFRPCHRCRPREALVLHPDAALVNRAAEYLAARVSEPIPLAELARAVGASPGRVQRTFCRALGVSPRQLAEALRLGRFKSLVQAGASITEALYESGFGSPSRLYERSNTRLGMTPATYRRGGEGMLIGYTIVRSPLGRMLVAATRRGISAVYFGKSAASLVETLRREYPRAELRLAGSDFSCWVRALLRHLHGRQPRLDLPLEIQATAFEQRVWQELRRIPYGATRTYSQLALAVGKLRGARAVARACAANPVSVVVPCHRVVRADGSLAGYRWGLDRKRALLALERATVVSRRESWRSGHRQQAI
jgi:AraC family transcriptional regulator of adaptative response/methylated-DNA-[protein]-cysteine methyltransferase